MGRLGTREASRCTSGHGPHRRQRPPARSIRDPTPYFVQYGPREKSWAAVGATSTRLPHRGPTRDREDTGVPPRGQTCSTASTTFHVIAVQTPRPRLRLQGFTRDLKLGNQWPVAPIRDHCRTGP